MCKAEKICVADIEDDGCESIEGEDRMPLLRVSIAGSEASIEMGECRAQVGDLALTIPKAQMKVDAIEAEINAEGIGQTHLRFLIILIWYWGLWCFHVFSMFFLDIS